ncbi:hypothetical protein PV419_01790 [Streptomyces sp. ME19-01-6]|nr:hypothetical protein [Streptomyces sp. ME19-01-6]MDX3224479.1 hypothetical protein [Streptomyces sp. ME19-01-6]
MEHDLVLMYGGKALLDDDEVSVISRHQEAVRTTDGERQQNDVNGPAVQLA